MNNPLDYLWYKVHRLSFYTHGKATRTTAMGTVLFINSYTICLLVFGMDVASFETSMLLIILSFILTCPYERYKKQIKVLRKYYKESEKSRIRGNIIVTVYVILSFAAPLIIAKFKNGYIFID
jgi:multisubunit Na+/H+ antiporter MnhF subunit